MTSLLQGQQRLIHFFINPSSESGKNTKNSDEHLTGLGWKISIIWVEISATDHPYEYYDHSPNETILASEVSNNRDRMLFHISTIVSSFLGRVELQPKRTKFS